MFGLVMSGFKSAERESERLHVVHQEDAVVASCRVSNRERVRANVSLASMSNWRRRSNSAIFCATVRFAYPATALGVVFRGLESGTPAVALVDRPRAA